MSKFTKKVSANLSKALLVGVCSLGLAISAHAAPEKAAANATMTKSTPVFLGGGGEYPFSSAVRVGDTLYMSGQLGFKDGKLVEGGIEAETKQVLDNINGVLLQYGYKKSDLVKCMVMLTDINDFNAFNEVYKAELAKPYPVRSAFAVKDLAVGANVEVECIAAK
ncbi:RidA family protein [Psychrobacter fulvigenes]|uniref:RidA family protein n=1 Tax=Psychrobacter fulvigenes TaxID=533323 RepID=UPI0019182A7D|nr:Rid family hydrolase [Psychrobacter fulvigenes]